MRPNSGDAKSQEKDIAKYFVPASTIRTFIPRELRWARLSEQIFHVDKWSVCRG